MIAAAQQLPFITDYLGLQDDLTAMLLSHAPLAQVNATQERKFLMQSDVDIDSLWQNPRNGGTGAGIIVEDIKVQSNKDQPGSAGPVSDLLVGFVILAERNICLSPAGCGWQPENLEQAIVDLFHQKVMMPYGQLRAEGLYAQNAGDWIDPQTGIFARRVTLKMLSARKQTPTADMVTISASNGTVTITCTNPSAQIYFTTDGSFPSNDSTINPQSSLYVTSFAAAAGTVVRAVAYAANLNPSSLKQITV